MFSKRLQNFSASQVKRREQTQALLTMTCRPHVAVPSRLRNERTPVGTVLLADRACSTGPKGVFPTSVFSIGVSVHHPHPNALVRYRQENIWVSAA